MDYSQIKESNADPARDLQFNVTGGTIAISKIVSSSLSWTMTRRKIKASPRNIKNYRDILHDLRGRNVVLYDTQAKRSWLIDGEQACLQILLHRSKARVDYILPDVKIIAVDPYVGLTAPMAMLANERLRLRTDWEAEKGEEVEVWFSNEVRIVWEMLKELSIFAHTESRRSFSLSDKMGKRCLLGYDYLALISSPAELQEQLKTVQLESECGEWPEIAKHHASIVLFAKNFQQVLRPSDRDQLCLNHRELPQGKSYLATELNTISNFLRDSALSWTTTEHLFPQCTREDDQVCNHDIVQTLAKSKSCQEFVSSWKDGAVIFGNSRPKRLQKQQKQKPIGKPFH
jgi:hypothetical protein